jgi:hypothetical protein
MIRMLCYCALRAFQPLTGETLFADVSMACDMTQARGRVLCLTPDTVAIGAAPHLTSWIYLEWQQVKDVTPSAGGSAQAGIERRLSNDSDGEE